MATWLSNLHTRSLAVRAGLLAAAMIGACLLAAPVGWHAHGRAGWKAAVAAALICWLGATAALVAAEPFRAAGRMLHAMLVGMILRMGIPLAGALVVGSRVENLIAAGFPYYVVFFFEVALVVEVLLSLPPIPQPEKKTTDPAR
ncbi:MAG TPA: hypothetical protein VJL29_09240 [Thermoguttaceae bacterium]|nr:hypothetical protein [Thermoguttaceae bacterium]